jgi:Asp-tRNA(Asn)/Glu-tRNA(Gln) amidotransferase A subunit family amidase
MCASAGGLPGGGAVPLSDRFDRIGLMAADGADLDLAWRQLTGASPVPVPAEVYTLAPRSLGRVDPERLAAAETAAHALSQAATELDGPPLAAFGAARAIVVTADAAQRHRAADAEFLVVRRQLEMGQAHAAAEIAAARLRLDELDEQLRAGIGSGVLVLPALPGAPPRWEKIPGVDDQLREIGRLTRLCAPANSSGLAAISVPWSPDAVGRPIGVQVMAASEAVALRAAAFLSPLPPSARVSTGRRGGGGRTGGSPAG